MLGGETGAAAWMTEEDCVVGLRTGDGDGDLFAFISFDGTVNSPR